MMYTIQYRLYLNPYEGPIVDIGELQISALELDVIPFSDDSKFIVGEWAEVKVTPTDVGFYSDFR